MRKLLLITFILVSITATATIAQTSTHSMPNQQTITGIYSHKTFTLKQSFNEQTQTYDKQYYDTADVN